MTDRRRSSLIFTGALVGVGLAVAFAFLRVPAGEGRTYFLYYNSPIAAPFVAFLLERALSPTRSLARHMVDAILIGVALLRAFVLVPFYSGHTIFLVYVSLVAETRTTRFLAGAVLLEVALIKIFLWHDALTLAGGTILALATWRVERWVRARSSAADALAKEKS